MISSTGVVSAWDTDMSISSIRRRSTVSCRSQSASETTSRYICSSWYICGTSMDLVAYNIATSIAALQVSQPPLGAGCHGAACAAQLSVVHALALTSLDPIAQCHIQANVAAYLRSTCHPTRCVTPAPSSLSNRQASPKSRSFDVRPALTNNSASAVGSILLFFLRIRRWRVCLANRGQPIAL